MFEIARHCERMVAAGLLGQWLSRHKAHGGDDPREYDVKALINDGAPLQASKKKTTAHRPSMTRAPLMYANRAVRQAKDAGVVGANVKTLRREAARRFRDLAPEEKAAYQAAAREAALSLPKEEGPI